MQKKKSPVSLFVHVLVTLGKQKLQDKSTGDQLQLILPIQTSNPEKLATHFYQNLLKNHSIKDL